MTYSPDEPRDEKGQWASDGGSVPMRSSDADRRFGKNAGYVTGLKAKLGGHVVIYKAREQGLSGGKYAVMHEPSSHHIVVRTLGQAKDIMRGVATAKTTDEAAHYADIHPGKKKP